MNFLMLQKTVQTLLYNPCNYQYHFITIYVSEDMCIVTFKNQSTFQFISPISVCIYLCLYTYITSWQTDGETVADFILGAPKSRQMMIVARKLKDAYSLEGKL